MAQMIIDGLRPNASRSAGPDLHDTGDDGDVEEDYSPRRRGGAPKRRDCSENALSVGSKSIRFRPPLR